MSDVSVLYKGSTIATMDASGAKTLATAGKYCEDNIEIQYVKSGGGGSSNTPVADATVTQVTVTGNIQSFDVTLSKTVTKCVVQIEADSSTFSDMTDQSTTTYYLLYASFFYPQETKNINNTDYLVNGIVYAYRGSNTSFNPRMINSAALPNVVINGTTATINIPVGSAYYFPSGAYKVKIWELADS